MAEIAAGVVGSTVREVLKVEAVREKTRMAAFEARVISAEEADGTKVPAHELVYRRLRAQVLFGEIAPGQAVTIQGLTASLGAGMTPVREAIRRVIAEGGLNFQGNRRVSVPVLNRACIEELVFLRATIEPELTRRAATRLEAGDIDWLEAVDAEMDVAIEAGDIATYLKRNHAFHSAIYEAADAPIMASTADRLWLRFGPSLRVVCGQYDAAREPDLHKDMLAAFRSGDAAAAAAAMERDVRQGMGQIQSALIENLFSP
tara:strand:+ start:4338 stop:5117 length:780 start_codon:yes stop_codon:yes gene_type:complete